MNRRFWKAAVALASSSGWAAGCVGGPGGSASSAGSTSSDAAATSNTLGITDIRVGDGAQVASRQCAYVHFVGLLANGRQFDGTRDTLANGQPQEPVAFELGARQVMPGWDQGVVGMRVGGMRRLWVPYRLAYGAGGRPPVIPPRTDLVFDIELVAVAAPLRSGRCPLLRDVARE